MIRPYVLFGLISTFSFSIIAQAQQPNQTIKDPTLKELVESTLKTTINTRLQTSKTLDQLLKERDIKTAGILYLIDKSERKLYVCINPEENPDIDEMPCIKAFDIDLSYNQRFEEEQGDKVKRKDGRVPEGFFYITSKKSRGETNYYKGLLLSYPSIEHASRALNEGKIDTKTLHRIKRAHRQCKTPPQNTLLGSGIYIHGIDANHPNGRGRDWTDGCTATRTNADMDQLYDLAKEGCTQGRYNTTVIIIP